MWLRRLAWFAGLWSISVAALGVFSLILKFTIGR
jgi:hypothetical protein